MVTEKGGIVFDMPFAVIYSGLDKSMLHKYVEDRWMNVSNINILVGSSSFYELSFYFHHLIWAFGLPW